MTARRACIAALVLACLAYANAPAGEFQFDDLHSVQNNPSIRSLANIPTFFTTPQAFTVFEGTQNVYRPVLLASFALNYAISGPEAWSYKLGNVLLHACVSVMVVLLALRLWKDPWSAAAAGALFAVHPVFSESVDYVSSRSSVLATALALGAFLLWWRSLEGRGRGAGGEALGAACALLLLGLLTKVIAVTVPALAVVAHLLTRREGRRSLRPVLHHAALWGTTVGYLALRWAVLRAGSFQVGTVGEDAPRTVLANLLTQARVLAFHYPRLFLWPSGLSPEHEVAETLAADLPSLAAVALLAVAAGTALSVLLRRRDGGRTAAGAAAGLLWYLVALAPTSSLIPLKVVMNEHRLYLPGAGLLAAAGGLLVAGWRRVAAGKAPAAAGPALLALALAVLVPVTWQRNAVWRHAEGLWRDVLEKHPGSVRAHVYLAKALAERGDFTAAETLYRRILDLRPESFQGPANLGSLLMIRARRLQEQGLQEEADALRAEAGGLLERGAGMGARYAEPLYNYALYLEQEEGELARAGQLYLKALLRNPGWRDALLSARRVVRALDAADEGDATLQLAEALVKLSGAPPDRMLLGVALARKSRYSDARSEFLSVLRVEPGSVQAMLNLGNTWAAQGDRAQAEQWYRQALQVDPGSQAAHRALERLGVR